MKVNTMDTVVGTNTAFHDDSLEYLSAEERACLMFLEETIDALDTEEDIGLAGEEPDCMPAPGNLASRVANLSASMSLGKLTDVSLFRKAQPMNKLHNDHHNPILNYLVPTPLVLANGSSNFLSNDRNGGLSFTTFNKPNPVPFKNRPQPAARSVPPEVSVLVIPPPAKVSTNQSKAQRELPPTPLEPWKLPKKPLQPQAQQQCGSPRRPLSYEGLAKLRKTGSMKKDSSQTSESSNALSTEMPSAGNQNVYAQLDRTAARKASPPNVAPKPKAIPPSVSAAPGHPQPDGTVMNPQKVRMEALYKLGLLKDQEASTAGSGTGQTSASKWARPQACPEPPHPPGNPTSRHASAVRGPVPDPPRSRPPPPPVRNPEATSRPPVHWTSAKVHHRSLSDLSSDPHPMTVAGPLAERSATIERCGPGLHTGYSPPGRVASVTAQTARADGKTAPPQWGNVLDSATPVGSVTSRHTRMNSKDGVPKEGGSLPAAGVQLQTPEPGARGLSVAHTVLMVPPMDQDRREALRKLGLLKI